MLLKISNDEKLTEDEMDEIKKVLADIDNLTKGGWINKPKGMVQDSHKRKWKKIADNGRKYALENLNNDKAVNSLVDLMEELL